MLEKIKKLTKKQKIIIASVTGALVIATIAILLFVFLKPEKENKPAMESIKIEQPKKKEKEKKNEETEEAEPEEKEEIIPEKEADPQKSVKSNKGTGAVVNISNVVKQENTNTVSGNIAHGIDVSKWQGKNIDWEKVANSGIRFAIVRVGYRTLGSGAINEDPYAAYNMREASKYGIKVGAYFFSTAKTTEEALEEANRVLDFISGYKITYPIAYDCEGFKDSSNRHYGLSNAQRTDIALAFLNRIASKGYSTLFYGSKSDMQNSNQWDMNRINAAHKVWVAQYPSTPYPGTQASSYTGTHVMWQYTDKGTVPGIKGYVDMNIEYLKGEIPKEPEAEGMKFTAVNETVTAKEETNLRDKPSQGEESKVICTLLNGQTATRTGISDSGWSRVEYNGQIYYAVSSYLTTDLDYKPPQDELDDGIVTQFTVVDEKVTAKEVTNLRTLPSEEHPDSQVVVELKNGEVITRTGINTDVGWSRVVYNGQTLYCISSYLNVVE